MGGEKRKASGGGDIKKRRDADERPRGNSCFSSSGRGVTRRIWFPPEKPTSSVRKPLSNSTRSASLGTRRGMTTNKTRLCQIAIFINNLNNCTPCPIIVTKSQLLFLNVQR